MKVGFLGLGKLGLPCALAIESRGHEVIGHDPLPAVRECLLNTRKLRYEEAGAQEALNKSNIKLVGVHELAQRSDIVFVAVQTPHDHKFEGITPLTQERKDFGYGFLETALDNLFGEIQSCTHVPVVVIISTVLPGTIRRVVEPLLRKHGIEKQPICYNPFFIAMGTAMRDFLEPEFVLLGGSDNYAHNVVKEFYSTIHTKPVFTTTLENAELIKVLYNTYIGTKIAFANTIMEICHKTPKTNCDDVIDALSLATERLISSKYLRGGMGDGGGCMPTGSLVLTEHGPRAIETVEPGTRVLTRSGTLSPVVKRWERDYCGDVLSVRVEGQPAATFTTDHPMLVASDGRTTSPSTGRRYTNIAVAEKLSPELEINAESVVIGDYIPTAVVASGSQVSSIPDHVTLEYCQLAGWYLSEGSLEIRDRRSGRICFSLHVDERPIAEWLARTLVTVSPPRITGRGAGAIPVITTRQANGLEVRYGSLTLANKLLKDFGKLAEHKTLPVWVTYGPLWVGEEVLRGLWQGDGHSSDRGFSFSTTSIDLAYGVQVLLNRMDIPSELRDIPARVSDSGQKHKRAFEVRVRNAVYYEAMTKLTGLPSPSWKDQKLYTRYPKKNGAYYRKVRALESKHYEGKVWNLWVEGDHTYSTSIGAVHNCHPRDNIALSWLARELKLSHDVFEDIMKTREDQTKWLADLIIAEHRRTGFPIRLMGQAFKANTNIDTGSPAILLMGYLEERGYRYSVNDPFVFLAESKEDQPFVYFISTCHDIWKNHNFFPGSVVIDPWRFLKLSSDVTYVPVGVGVS